METIEFKEHSLSRNCIYLKSIINIETDDILYVLSTKNYIEIRTRSQQEALLNKIIRLIQSNIGDEEKNKYEKLEYKVRNYSKPVKVTSKGSINLGSSVAGYYGLSSDGKVIIEKCNDCIRLWNPNMFNIYYDNLANNGKRRK